MLQLTHFHTTNNSSLSIFLLLSSLASNSANANNGVSNTNATESELENGSGSGGGSGAATNGSNGGGPGPVTPVLGPEATPRARVSHGHVKSASISAGSGNTQSTISNRETVASASAAERDSQRWRSVLRLDFCMPLTVN